MHAVLANSGQSGFDWKGQIVEDYLLNTLLQGGICRVRQ